MNWVKWVPAIALVVTFIATTAVSQYQIGVLVDGQKAGQETQSTLVVNQATMDLRLQHLEDK